MMRVAATFLAAAALFAAGAPSSASAGVIDSFCSPSGDYCTGILRQEGRIEFSISTFSFTGEYKLTVKLLDPRRVCRALRTYTLRPKSNGIYESRIDFTRNFPCESEPGRYAVTWRRAGSQLGPPLHMRIR